MDRELSARLDAIDTRLDAIARQQKKNEELFAEMTPILREAMGAATSKLAELEQRGYFAFGKEALGIADRVVTGFSPDDVRAFGNAIVGILQTVRAFTQQKPLEIATEAAAVLEKADDAEPIGIMGVVRATRNDDVQKGMAVMMEVMKHVGRAARAVREERAKDPLETKKAKLAEALGPRKKKILGVERPAAPLATPPKPANAKPAPASGTTIDGVAFGADGHMLDSNAWTRDLASKLAALQGVELDAARWALVDFARTDYAANGASPNIRRITQGANLATKDVYALFPKAPARTIAKIAGIPKPTGCI